MKLDEIVAWYQKKIGTYDKQQWEKTVEQKILSGFTSITLKTTKLKTEFIDVDLVRGSTFQKAKPKQSLLTVIRLTILRYFFLPIYAKWWVSQTSPLIFGLLLVFYMMQMINWGIYSFHIHKSESNSEHIVSLSELIAPMVLSVILSFIHSQIVATNSINSSSSKSKRLITAAGKPRERIRRRKKLTRVRSTEHETAQYTKYASKTYARNSVTTQADLQAPPLRLRNVNVVQKPGVPSPNLQETNKLDNIEQFDVIVESNAQLSPNSKKRNVNWDLAIHNDVSTCATLGDSSSNTNDEKCATSDSSSFKSKIEQIDDSVQEFFDDLIRSAADDDTNRDQVVRNDEIDEERDIVEPTGEDDGFESLNGKSSSGEENHLLDVSETAINIRKLENAICAGSTSAQSTSQLRLRKSGTGPSSTNNSNKTLSDEEVLFVAKNESDLQKKTLLHQSQGYRKKVPLSSESDMESHQKFPHKSTLSSEILQKKNVNIANVSSETDEEGDDGEIISSPASISNANYTECTTSATEWLGVTTNSEECSYSSDIDHSDFQHDLSDDAMEYDFAPTVILNPSCGPSDRINCTIWEHNEIKKAEMSVLDISSCIIERVEAMPETCDYLYVGVVFSIILSFVPAFCRLCEQATEWDNTQEIHYLDVPYLLLEKASFSALSIFRLGFGKAQWEQIVLIIAFIQRLFLTFLLFFLFAVAERTFKQRFLYAKLFSHLTSLRRARKSDLPHFRLNKVRNIKTWLSVRSYLKRRGPQRSVDVIVSVAFIITLLLIAFLSVEWIKESDHLHSQLNMEALMWSTALGLYLLRFMTLGNKINRKYRSISVLITEQINLYLQIEQKPKKKEELMVSNSVLKLAGDLLKELESPFKISGLSANPYLYTTIKVVLLSALSGVLSEMLGFKLKLHKIKIK